MTSLTVLFWFVEKVARLIVMFCSLHSPVWQRSPNAFGKCICIHSLNDPSLLASTLLDSYHNVSLGSIQDCIVTQMCCPTVGSLVCADTAHCRF